MTRWSALAVFTGTLLLLGAPAVAQVEEFEENETTRFAISVGAGLVEPAGDVETYFMAALRIRLGGRADQRGRGPEGVDAYIEPEVGYWEDSDLSAADTHFGLNLIGVVPFGNVDSFFGVGAALHSIDAELLQDVGDGSATKLGVNSQFGLDLYLSDSWSLFGTGRFDLVQDTESDLQSKVYLGIRGRF